MPTLVPAELDNWMQDLQVELQSAMNLGRPTSCGGSQHEIGRRCITDGLLDRWNGDVKAKPSVAEAIRHQCGLTGVRVGEADNPGPSRRRRTQRLRALPWVWDSDSELEDDHRNVVQRVDPCVPPDVVDELEQDLREPAMVPADPNVEVGKQCNEDFQESTEEMGDLTRVDSDEEPRPRSHSAIGCLQEAREVFRMLMMSCFCPMPGLLRCPRLPMTCPPLRLIPAPGPTVSLLCPQRPMTSPFCRQWEQHRPEED